jgi:uncharacterized membrane protein
MAKSTFAEHPLHPMLIVFPAGLMPFSFVMDLMYMVTRQTCYAKAAYYSMLTGYAGGLAAAIAGGLDYFSIPPGREVKRTANTHAILNLMGMGVYSLNLLLRRGRERPSGMLTTLLSAVGVAGVFISAWFGGHMVYEHGVRVRGVSPTDRGADVKLGGERLAEWLKEMQERFAPAEEEMMA